MSNSRLIFYFFFEKLCNKGLSLRIFGNFDRKLFFLLSTKNLLQTRFDTVLKFYLLSMRNPSITQLVTLQRNSQTFSSLKKVWLLWLGTVFEFYIDCRFSDSTCSDREFCNCEIHDVSSALERFYKICKIGLDFLSFDFWTSPHLLHLKHPKLIFRIILLTQAPTRHCFSYSPWRA